MGTIEKVLALLLSLFGCFVAVIGVTSPKPLSKRLTIFLQIICTFFLLVIVLYAIKYIFISDDEYILPYSNTRTLTEGDINTFDEKKLILARNEIYARHGRLFQDENIQRYFNTKSWYKGVIPPEEFRPETLSLIEQQNVDFIREYEKKIRKE